MRILHRREAALLLPLCTTLTAAISLSDFTPRTLNLPSTCDAAYSVQIPNCQPSDFQKGLPCSADCIRGLMSVGARVTVDCLGANVKSDSLVGLFMSGLGVQALCPNANAPTIGSSFNPSVTIGQSTGTTKRSQTAAITATTRTTKTTPTGLLFDTSSSPLPPSTTAETQTTTTKTQSSQATLPAVVTTTAITSANLATINTTPAVSTTLVSGVTTSRAPTQTQNPNSDGGSGGGSPFDIASTAARDQVWSWGMAGAAAVAFAAYLA